MARKPSDASHRRKGDKFDDLNLTPIMSMLVILIPMLLAMFNFFEVKVQAVAAPKLGSGTAKSGDDKEKPLNLTVLISKTGFAIKLQDEHQSAFPPTMFTPIQRDVLRYEGTSEAGTTTEMQGEQYDFATLYNRLEELKSKFDKETTINIAAEMDIPWHVVARTIDSARVKLVGGPFTGDRRLIEYSHAKPEMVPCKADCDGDNEMTAADVEPKEMFGRVVFVVAE